MEFSGICRVLCTEQTGCSDGKQSTKKKNGQEVVKSEKQKESQKGVRMTMTGAAKTEDERRGRTQGTGKVKKPQASKILDI